MIPSAYASTKQSAGCEHTTTEGEGSADDLTIANANNCGITLRSGTAFQSNIFFLDGTSGRRIHEYDGLSLTTKTLAHVVWHTQTERVRINSSVFVGINETSPSSQLTVKRANTSTSGLSGVLKLKQGSATNGNRASLLFTSLDDFDVAAVNGVIETHSGTESNNEGRLEFWTKHSGSSIALRADSTQSEYSTTLQIMEYILKQVTVLVI